MHRTTPRYPLLFTAAMALAVAACGGPDTPAPETAASPAPSAGQTTVEDWSAQTRDAMDAATPDDMAAEGVAAGRAMAETCGFTPAELSRFRSQETGSDRGAEFERRVEAQLPRLRQAQQAQQRADTAGYAANCDYMRFMMDNRG